MEKTLLSLFFGNIWLKASFELDTLALTLALTAGAKPEKVSRQYQTEFARATLVP